MIGGVPSVADRVARFRAWQNGELMPPLKMYICPTGRCNLQCKYCVHALPTHRHEHYGSDIDGDSLLRLIREGLGIGIRWFNIVGGGEPFLEKGLALEMMRAIRQGKADGAITTNAFLVDEDVLRAMVELQWNNLVLSLDSHDPKTADVLRAKGAFRHCVRVLDELKRLKKERKSSLPCVELNPVMTSENYTHIEGILRFAAKHGVGKVTFTPVTIHADFQQQLKLSGKQAEEFQSNARAAIPLSERLGVNTNLASLLDSRLATETGNMINLMEAEASVHDARSGEPEPRSGGMFGRMFSRLRIPFRRLARTGNPPVAPQALHAPYPLCFEPWDSIVILPSGYVNPCQVSNKVSHARERSLKDIWHHDPYLESMRERHAARDLPDFCRKCCSALIAERLATQREMMRDSQAAEVPG